MRLRQIINCLNQFPVAACDPAARVAASGLSNWGPVRAEARWPHIRVTARTITAKL
jgi:hypothetical protein